MIEVNEKPYRFLQANRDKRFIYLFGGASSSKSETTGQFLVIEKAGKEKNIGILVTRITRPAVKVSCWPLIHKWLDKAEMPYEENKTDMRVVLPNGNFFLFDGLDNVFKKKSIVGINYVWVEELAGLGYEAALTEREFIHLDILCRAQNENGINQIFSTFNPIDPIGNEWIKKRADGEDADKDNSARLRINHAENPFLSVEEHKRIEALIHQDPEYDKIYRQGLWATPTNMIYSNWDIVANMPERCDVLVWGLDFGYSGNETALVELRFIGDEVWEKEHIYQTHLTNPQLIQKLKMAMPNQYDVLIADSAEPKSIQEIRNAGFNIHPCQKGPDSVRHGINTVKALKCHITADSPNLIKEKRGYKWKLDKDDRPLPSPVEFMNHLMDAERYVIQKVKGKVKAGLLVVGGSEEKERVEIPVGREAILASRYPQPKVVERGNRTELDIDDDDLWSEI